MENADSGAQEFLDFMKKSYAGSGKNLVGELLDNWQYLTGALKSLQEASSRLENRNRRWKDTRLVNHALLTLKLAVFQLRAAIEVEAERLKERG